MYVCMYVNIYIYIYIYRLRLMAEESPKFGSAAL